MCSTALSPCNPVHVVVFICPVWMLILSFKCLNLFLFLDYLKNLSEDSADYKDTQGKLEGFFFHISVFQTNLQPFIE